MGKWVILIFFVSNFAHALDAVITVLEAPLFKHKSLDAPVVQYKRRGDIIRIHGSVDNNSDYDYLSPSVEKLRKIQAESNSKDPLFAETPETYSLEDDDFIATRDRLGREAYVLSSHIYVYFNSPKEFGQTIPVKDPTDYRLQEPLPKNFPLKSTGGLRGQVYLGFMQPYTESYPYLKSVQSKGYTNPVELNVNLLKNAKSDQQDRDFFGLNLNFRYFENKYSLTDKSIATETGTQLGLGPFVSYDAFKGDRNRVMVFGVIDFYFYQQVAISQNGPAGSDQRNYRAYSLIPKLGSQYHRKNIVDGIDFLTGASMEFDPPTRFHAINGAHVEGIWQKPGTDVFTTRSTVGISLFLGIQSVY